MKDIIKQLFCNHTEAVHPLKDSTKWVVAEMCDKCHKVWIRKGIPNYDIRLMETVRIKAEFKELSQEK